MNDLSSNNLNFNYGKNFNLQEDFLQCLKGLCTCETDLNQSLLLWSNFDPLKQIFPPPEEHPKHCFNLTFVS